MAAAFAIKSASLLFSSPVVRLPNSILIAALRFIQQLGGATTLSELRAMVPAGLGSLVSSDRVSMDEIDLSRERPKVIPSPVPAWWRRLGEVHQKYVHEHPLFDVEKINCNQVIAFSDYACDAKWNSSTLYHEYYVSLGIRCQLGVQVSRAGTGITSVSFSRALRDFRPRDRALVALLSPHIGNAYRTAVALAEARSCHGTFSESAPVCGEIIAVKSDCRTIRNHSVGAMELVDEFFADRTGVDAVLPEDVCRWLVKRKELLLRGELSVEPFSPLVICRGPNRLTLRVATIGPEEIILLLEPERVGGGEKIAGGDVLTKREHEILRWAGEGKRNGEIGIILGVSLRTVEKHLENSFRKLGVETRTAAIRQLSDSRNRRHA